MIGRMTPVSDESVVSRLSATGSHTAQTPHAHPGRVSTTGRSGHAAITPWPDHLTRLPYAALFKAGPVPAEPTSPRRASSRAPALVPAMPPKVLQRSTRIAEVLARAWRDPTASLVYNFDMELDDIQRLNHVLGVWQRLPSHGRAQLVIVAGERTGGEDTFDEAQRLVSSRLSQTIDGQGAPAWQVLRGAPLKGAEVPALNQAVDALAAALEERPYVFHNNTSEVLFAALPPALQARCMAHVCTCDLILTPKGPIYGTNYRWQPEAHAKSLAACAAYGVPFVSVHGSTLGFAKQSLSELPEWQAVLGSAMLDPTYARQQARFAMQQVLVWATRIYGALSGSSGQQLANQANHWLNDAVAAEFGEAAPETVRAWRGKPGLVATYSAEDCELTNAEKRARALAENISCPVNNTMGDFAAAVIDAPVANTAVLFVPLAVDVGAKAKPEGLHVGFDESLRYMAVNGDEQDLMNVFEASRKSAGEDGDGSMPAAPLIDDQLAGEWRAFTSAMQQVLAAALQAQAIDGAEELKVHLERAQAQLEKGAMAELVSAIQ